MALNWAMAAEDGKNLVLLPDERIFYGQDGVRFELECGGGYPGNCGTYIGSGGRLFVTNQRIVFLNSPSSAGFKSMSIPIGNVRDGFFKQPWFSANVYEAVVMPVPNGGLRGPGSMKLYFKQGGGFEFLTTVERLFERRHEAEGANVEHLDELPTYEPESDRTVPSLAASTVAPTQRATPTVTTSTAPTFTGPPPPMPEGLPPSYDQVVSPSR